MLRIKTNFRPVAGETKDYFKKKKENTKSCLFKYCIKSHALMAVFPTSIRYGAGGGGESALDDGTIFSLSMCP
jgi:hypothetical protein